MGKATAPPITFTSYTATVPPTTPGGGGGDPHFVGFDGVFFNYHGVPGRWYLLWEGSGLTVKALFDLEPAAAKYRAFRGTTVITDLIIEIEGSKIPISAKDQWVLDDELPIESKLGTARGLPPQLQQIEGVVEGIKEIPFDCGTVVISCMSFRKKFQFLNVAFNLKKRSVATGILGQTQRTVPEDQRKSNDYFWLEGDQL